jgi:plasmid stability protein
MKTTLVLPDDLYRDVKVTAALAGRSVTSLVEEALRDLLQRRHGEEDLAPLPVSRHRWELSPEFVASGVEFSDTSELLAWLDDAEGRAL